MYVFIYFLQAPSSRLLLLINQLTNYLINHYLSIPSLISSLFYSIPWLKSTLNIKFEQIEKKNGRKFETTLFSNNSILHCRSKTKCGNRHT